MCARSKSAIRQVLEGAVPLALALISVPSTASPQDVFVRSQLTSGMIWTDESGIPYTGTATLHLGWSLGNPELRSQQNLLLGPIMGVRFAHLVDTAQEWEGFGGVRVSGRVLRAAVPVDVIWGFDASVGTRLRVPVGASIGAGLQQGLTINLRVAYDVKHTEPLLEGVVSVPIATLGKASAPECPGLPVGSPRSLAGRIRLQAATLSRMLEPDNSNLPTALPESVIDLDSFITAMRGRVPADALDRDHLERLIRTAGADPAEHDDRDTAWLILDGWEARIALRRCRQP